MATVIQIRVAGGEARLYGKPDDVALATITDPAVLWSAEPKIYLTGLGALPTQKRLVALLAKIDPTTKYEFERLAAEDVLRAPGLTAGARHEGRVMPKYGRGG